MSEGQGKVAAVAGGGILAIFAGMGRFADDCGRAALSTGDDVARMSNVGDDLARTGFRSSDDLAVAGMHGDDFARAGVHGENLAAGRTGVTSSELGFSPAVARQAQRYRSTAPGPRPLHYAQGTRARFAVALDAAPTSASSFADDLTRATVEAGMDPAAVADLLDAFLTAQEIAEAHGAALDTAATMTTEIDAHLATLSPRARLAVERQLGPPHVIAYRLAEGRPLRRADSE